MRGKTKRFLPATLAGVFLGLVFLGLGGCADGTEVVLYTIEGGGHVWPGGLRLRRSDDPSHAISATDIIWQAREAYDMVVVDTAAILPTNRSMVDPVTFSRAADGTLMVVLNCVTPKQQVKRAHMILEASGAKILGVVVNQWKNPML